MLNKHVPNTFDPVRFAKTQESMEGFIALDKLSLSTDFLVGSAGQVGYKLSFGVDPENYVYIQGVVEAMLPLECQRCLKPMEYPIHAEFRLSPVQSVAEAGALPDRYEAILMEEGKLSVLRIVEEELILSLPIAPMHDKACYFEKG